MAFLRSPVLRQQMPSPMGWTSKYGPHTKARPRLGSFPLANSVRYAPLAASMGAAALIAILFLGEEIPTVKRDIFQNLPIVGGYWKKEVAPEDNPF